MAEQQDDQQQNPENTTKLLSGARSRYYQGLIDRAGIPKRYADKGIDNFEGNQELIDKNIKAILKGDSIFIGGKCGTGKTHLAIGLLKKWAREYTINKITEENMDHSELMLTTFTGRMKFLASVDLFLELKATFNSRSEDELDVIKKYTQCSLLLIDDVGSEKISDWSRQIFYLLIDRRYREVKPTIITSNLSLGQIAELIDERISSRICEMGIVTELTGKDRRVE